MPALSLARYVVTLALNLTKTEINIFSESITTSELTFTFSESRQLRQKKYLQESLPEVVMLILNK